MSETLSPWETKQAAARTALAAILTAVVAELGEGWSFRPYSEESDWHIMTDDNTVAMLSANFEDSYTLDGRLVFSVHYTPEENREARTTGGEYPGITVSATRPAKALAGEIKRRLLPDVIAARTKVLARVVATRKANVAQDKTIDAIYKALGKPYTPTPEDHRGQAWYGNITLYGDDTSVGEKGYSYGSIKVGYNGDLRLELSSVKLDRLLNILAQFGE